MPVGLGVSAACAIAAIIAAAATAAWAAAAVYSLGFFAVLASESEFDDGASSVPAPACRDGSVYSGDPGYAGMNGATAVLALLAALLVIGAGCAAGLRARKAPAAA